MILGRQRDELINVLIKLGPTILGAKPGEILNVKTGPVLDNCKMAIKSYKKTDYLEIKRIEKYSRFQVFFYHKEVLLEILRKKVNRDFLVSLGYPIDCNLHSYLQILKGKLLSDKFPHEIGIFLGYPLKDVLGFMGQYPLKLVEIQGWRYYGSNKLSQIYYNKFCKAQAKFASILIELDNPEEFYNYLEKS